MPDVATAARLRLPAATRGSVDDHEINVAPALLVGCLGPGRRHHDRGDHGTRFGPGHHWVERRWVRRGCAQGARQQLNSRDNTNPSINLLRLSPSTLDVTGGGKKLTVRTKLSDAGGPGPASGVSGATVTLRSVSGPSTVFNVSLRRAKKPFVWTATQFFPSGITPGAWQVSSVYVTDKAGGTRVLDYADLTLPVYDRDFTVTSVPDTSVPDLLHLSLTPKRVDTRKRPQSVVITAKARDTQSAGVDFVDIGAVDGKGHEASADLRAVKGVKNTFRGRMYIAQWQGSGRWHFQSATVGDRVGNRQEYTRGDLASLGGDHTFQVIGRIDKAKPSIGASTSPLATSTCARSRSRSSSASVRETRCRASSSGTPRWSTTARWSA